MARLRRLASSLQFRLVAGFALILSAALLSVSWYVSAESAREAEKSEELRWEVRAERARAALDEYFAERKAWHDVQSTVEGLGKLLGARILVRDAEGRIVADSHVWLRPPPGAARPIWLVSGDGTRIGSVDLLSIRSLLEEHSLEPEESELAHRMSETLLWAGLAAGGVGILAVGLIARRALSPVRALSAAAERLGRGDLGQRVKPSGGDEVGRLGHAFNRMASQLEEAERQRRALLADVAHELRTPLSNIGGYVEAMRDGLAEPNAATLDIVRRQVAQLTRLVEDLRLLTLAESGALKFEARAESVQALVASVAEAFTPRASAKGLSLRVEAPAEIPPALMDRGRTEQVLHNLVENAVTHTPEGGSVTVAAAVGEEAHVRVSVRDTGPGLSPDALESVFERFYREDPSRSRVTGGAGLGLTIARQLIESQGGRIWAESEPGQGGTFTFELPSAAART